MGVGMKLSMMVNYAGGFKEAAARVVELEKAGLDQVWIAEAYSFDAISQVGYLAAITKRVEIGTGIVNVYSRSAALMAMTGAGCDYVSDGRFILGLGASGPQVVEGWYGQPYPKPLARTREYIEVVRSILKRDKPIDFHGEFYDIPLRGGSGLGKPLKSTVHPLRKDIPIFLGAEGPKNVALAGEICDGWLPLFFSPKEDAFYRKCLAEGFAKSGEAGKSDRFEVASGVMLIPGDDVEACANFVRPFLALYAGGMGARGANFHFEVFARMGYEDVALKVQELYLAGKKEEAAASIPLAMVEDVALVGPIDKIKDEMAKWRETCITTFLISGPPQVLETYAELVAG